MKKVFILFLLPFLDFAQSTLITAGGTANVSLPKLTYPQIMAISSPQAGMEAFDTDYGCVRIYNGNSWRCSDTPPNQPNLITTAVRSDNPSGTTVQQTFNDVFADGSVITVGNFGGNITFGGTTLTNAGSGGSTDIFMTKYTNTGSVAWTFRIGGNGNGSTLIGDDAVTDVAVEPSSQSFYIVGRIGSVSVTGAMTGATTNGTDGFIAKFDATGTLLWSSFFSGTSSNAYDGLNAISVVGSDVYVCGYQAGGASLGSVALGATNSSFVAKYNSTTGTAQWAYELSGASMVEIAGNSNRVVVTGSFFSSVNLGGIPYTTTGLFDVFVVCLDNLGTFQWGKTFGSNQADYSRSVTWVNNKILLTGSYFGALTCGNSILPVPSSQSIYLVQFDDLGNKEWIKSFHAFGSCEVNKIISDKIGSIYMCGTTAAKLWLGNQTLPTSFTSNAFVAKFSADGDCIWGKSYTSPSSLSIYSLSSILQNGINKVFFSGSFGGSSIQFGHSRLTTAAPNMFLGTTIEN